MYDDTRHRDPWENQPFLLDDDPILPEGWGRKEEPDSGEEAMEDAYQNGAGDTEAAGDSGGTGAADGTAVGAAGTAGAYPAPAGGTSDRGADGVSGRGLGTGDLFPSGDGETGPDSLNETDSGSGADSADSPEARLRAQAQAARLLYPELRDLSDREAVAVAIGGAGTLGAYADFRARENARLRQESERQETLRRAPVRGVSTGPVQIRGRDPFETGFDEDGW